MRQRGFSLVELLVSLGILTIVIVGFLSLFDTSARISRAQSAMADVQENLRYDMAELIRVGRMAGCGGVPAVTTVASGPPLLGAVDLQDNVSSGTTIGGLAVVPGTDILELRGSFSSPIYDIGTAIGGNYQYTGPDGSGTIPAVTVTGDSQDFSELAAQFASGAVSRVPVTFVTVQRGGYPLRGGHSRLMPNYGTAFLTNVANDGSFTFTTAVSSSDEAAFKALNPNGTYPSSLADVVRMAVIDEVRYFVALDPSTGVPTLYVNNVVTGTSEPLGTDVVDLQVAIGCDWAFTGDMPYIGATHGDDYWLFNNTHQDGGAESYADVVGADTVPLVAYMRQMRITLVSRVPAPDRAFVQPPIANEDGRDILADPSYLGVPSKNYRYRFLTDVVRLRSIGPIT